MTPKKNAPAIAAPGQGSGADRETAGPFAKRDDGASDASVPVRDLPVQTGFVAAALELVARGWSVFPVASNGKKPVGLLVPHGPKDATRDPATIAGWWRAYPTGNLGAVPPEGCYVLDLDLYKNASLQALVDRLAALHTPMQRSGGGGMHFLLRGSPPSENVLEAEWGRGIDVKAHGKGYILAAPSVHPTTGAFYEWGKPCTIPPADAPAWLMRDAAEKAKRTSKDDRSRSSMQNKPRTGLSIAGAREVLGHLPPHFCEDYHDWLRTGMALHHEFGRCQEVGDAIDLWDEWSKQAPHKYQTDACGEKWGTFGKSSGELVTMRTLLHAAQASGWQAPSRIAERPRAIPPLDEVDDGFLALVEPSDWLANAKASRFDLTSVPVMRWLFDGVAPQGKVLVLAGAGGSSKSYLALALAAHWAARKAFDVFVPVHGNAETDEVLVLFAEEDEDDIHRRYAATIRSAGFDSDEIERIGDRILVRSMLSLEDVSLAHYDETRDVVAGALLKRLRNALRTRPTIRWVVVDPLALLHELDENDNAGMAKLLRLLGRLAAEFDVAVWVVHHFSKQGAAADELNARAVRGATAIVDNARAAILLQRMTAADAQIAQTTPEEASRYVRLTFAKNSYGAVLESRMLRIRDDGSVEPLVTQPMPVPAGVARELRKRAVSEQAAEHREQAALHALLLLLQRQPRGVNAIYKEKPASYSRTVVERALAAAEQEGLVAAKNGPRNSKVYSLTTAGQMRIDGDSL